MGREEGGGFRLGNTCILIKKKKKKGNPNLLSVSRYSKCIHNVCYTQSSLESFVFLDYYLA